MQNYAGITSRYRISGANLLSAVFFGQGCAAGNVGLLCGVNRGLWSACHGQLTYASRLLLPGEQQAYDRLEVLEATSEAIFWCDKCGHPVCGLSKEETDEIYAIFGGSLVPRSLFVCIIITGIYTFYKQCYFCLGWIHH